jgi:hypothetical protein
VCVSVCCVLCLCVDFIFCGPRLCFPLGTQITFKDPSLAKQALEMNGSLLDGYDSVFVGFRPVQLLTFTACLSSHSAS